MSLRHCIAPLCVVWGMIAASWPWAGVVAATLDVTTFGAVPNDGLDDTVPIRNALLAAQAGDTVLLPAGAWHVSGPLRPKSSTTLAGVSRDDTMLLYLGSLPDAFIDVTSRNRLTIRDFTIDGQNNPAAETGIGGSGGGGHQIYNMRIQNLQLAEDDDESFGPHGIFFSGNVVNSVIRDSEFRNLGTNSEWGGGIRVANNSNGTQILRNTIENTGRGGIFADRASASTIQYNVVRGSGMYTYPDGEGGEGLGIEVWGGSHNSLIEHNDVDHWISVEGSHHVAVRRNSVGDVPADSKFIGLECADCYDSVFTSNTVDGGNHIGISVSGDTYNHNVYWARNTISRSETWGAQLQGETVNAVREMYFYDNKFDLTELSPPNAYSDAGHGFRINGNTHHVVFDSNEFVDNDRLGFQLGGANVDQLSFVDNTFTGNGAQAIRAAYGGSSTYPGSDLEWSGNVLSGNGGSGANTPFVAKGFATDQKPQIMLNAPAQVVAGLAYNFSFDFSDDGSLGRVLWDFDTGLPVTLQNPTRTFTEPGNYQVSLVVWDNTGRAAHATYLLPVVIPGDYNADGYVDDPDYTEWRSTYLSSSDLAADGNGDGVVDAADYTVWRNNLGSGIPPAMEILTLVPEPGATVLVALAMVMLVGVGQRHR